MNFGSLKFLISQNWLLKKNTTLKICFFLVTKYCPYFGSKKYFVSEYLISILPSLIFDILTKNMGKIIKNSDFSTLIVRFFIFWRLFKATEVFKKFESFFNKKSDYFSMILNNFYIYLIFLRFLKETPTTRSYGLLSFCTLFP